MRVYIFQNYIFSINLNIQRFRAISAQLSGDMHFDMLSDYTKTNVRHWITGVSSLQSELFGAD